MLRDPSDEDSDLASAIAQARASPPPRFFPVPASSSRRYAVAAGLPSPRGDVDGAGPNPCPLFF